MNERVKRLYILMLSDRLIFDAVNIRYNNPGKASSGFKAESKIDRAKTYIGELKEYYKP